MRGYAAVEGSEDQKGAGTPRPPAPRTPPPTWWYAGSLAVGTVALVALATSSRYGDGDGESLGSVRTELADIRAQLSRPPPVRVEFYSESL